VQSALGSWVMKWTCRSDCGRSQVGFQEQVVVLSLSHSIGCAVA
jgi:hypothetical protein